MSGPKKKQPRTNPKKKSTVVSSEKKWTESHLTLNEKTQPIQWTEQPTGALVTPGSLWPWPCKLLTIPVPTSPIII
jgi:hypothetical protein